MSTLISDMVVASGSDGEVPVPNVKTEVLGKVLEYCQYHKGTLPQVIPKPLKSANLIECGVDGFDCKYIDVEQDLIFALIQAANYLDIKGLLDLACAKVASMIKGRSVQEIRDTFNIVAEDFSPEEEAQIREENRYSQPSQPAGDPNAAHCRSQASRPAGDPNAGACLEQQENRAREDATHSRSQASQPAGDPNASISSSESAGAASSIRTFTPM